MDEPDRFVVPAYRERHHADAHRRQSASSRVRRRRSRPAGDGRAASSTGSPLPAEGPLRAARRRLARRGSTILTSASTTTCATPRSPLRATESQLRQMAGRVFSQHLDRNKPLWELWAVEGLEGPLGAALQGPSLHGRRRRGDRPDVGDVLRHHRPLAREWSATPEPSSLEVLVRTLRRVSPAGQLDTLQHALRTPRKRCARGEIARGDDLRRANHASGRAPPR